MAKMYVRCLIIGHITKTLGWMATARKMWVGLSALNLFRYNWIQKKSGRGVLVKEKHWKSAPFIATETYNISL